MIIRPECRKNFSAHSEIRMIHVRGFYSFRKTQCKISKFVCSHSKISKFKCYPLLLAFPHESGERCFMKVQNKNGFIDASMVYGGDVKEVEKDLALSPQGPGSEGISKKVSNEARTSQLAEAKLQGDARAA